MNIEIALGLVVVALVVASIPVWRSSRGATVHVTVNGRTMCQEARSIDDAFVLLCARWNGSEGHRAIATLTMDIGYIVPDMAPGVERVDFKLRMWEG